MVPLVGAGAAATLSSSSAGDYFTLDLGLAGGETLMGYLDIGASVGAVLIDIPDLVCGWIYE